MSRRIINYNYCLY